ncbi:adenylate/guanylate cyclase domain-containing protein [Acetobacter indonesiensis]|uniref:Histidine kinase n=1 Tax=Acetobacter indonesiensis TaxID=104101 RepID=A0A252AX95_9PROT|nr:adenylate/guanylate cyclase domain-containing protein [Acetobacter indonesiensis]MCP1230620.1 GAF domain-containing protein [Acetobacter indonesiensis]OUI95279.1 histidine kinase [Acetobacter indonesiensis]
MPSDEIIDPTLQHDVSVRRVLLHLVLPLLSLVLGIVAVILIGVHSYRTTRAGVETLTHELLGAVQHYIAQEVSDYIRPALGGNIIASSMIEHVPAGVQERVFYSYGAAMLRSIPQLQSFYLADDQGHFILITRHGKDGKQQERTTLQVHDGRKVFHHDYYTDDGVKVGEADDPAPEDYDPRKRAWYQNTEGTDAIKWTQPFLFPTDKQFVMTSSLRFKGQDGHTLVFATNISLNALSTFLDNIKVGKSGNAIVLDKQGRVMAGRNLMQIAESAGWDPNKMVLDPKTHPVFARGYDHYRVHGLGPRSFTINGKQYVTIAAPLPNSTEGWILLLSAPESDFASFAKQSSQQSLQFAGVIITFSLVLAALLIRQVRRSERSARLLKRQDTQIAHETSAVQQVAATPALFDPANDALVLTEQLAYITNAHRASIWRFLHDGSAMICEDSYDQKQDAHSGGFEMSRSELDAFFKAVEDGEAFTLPNAAIDARTTQFERLVMREIGTHVLAVYPIHGAGGVLGAVVLEDATMAPHLVYFVDLVASIAGMRLMALQGVSSPEDEKASGDDGGFHAALQNAASLPATRFDNMLMHAPEVGGVSSSGIYPAVAVLVITFSDPVVDGEKETEGLLALINQLATEVQRVAQERKLFAVEVAGHRMICMAGCTPDEDPTAVIRMADAALTMRETFMAALAAADLEPVFTMGLDYGAAFGGAVGEDPKVFNLWGQTVSLAELMAQGAADAGTIQVTERVYSALRDRYLFRSRGAFFAPHLGLGRAYVLAARR